MKKLLILLLLILAIVAIWLLIQSGNYEAPIDEAPGAMEPTSFNIGFDSIGVDVDIFFALLDQQWAEGIRFYNATPDPNSRTAGILLVAFNSDSVEIYGSTTMQYVYFDQNGNSQTLNREMAERYATGVLESEGLSGMISVIGRPNINGDPKTLFIVSDTFNYQEEDFPTVTLNFYNTTDGESRRLASIRSQPCPPMCPRPGIMLYEPTEGINGGGETEGR